MSKISARKESELRKYTKETLAGLRKAWKSVIDKADRGETLRDEDLRFLRNIPELIEALESRVAESLKEDMGLPEGKLKEYVERLWEFKEIGSLEDVIEATGYYRCINGCGELHKKGEDCIYEQYKKLKEESTKQSLNT